MIEEDYKKVCGKLLGYYRKKYYRQTKSYQYTQRGMIQKQRDDLDFKQQKTLCSTTTLRRLESGVPYHREALYMALAKRNQTRYVYSRRLLNKVEQWVQDLDSYAREMDLLKMEELYHFICQAQEQKILYYQEVIRFIHDFLSFYLYRQLPQKEDLYFYLETYSFYPKRLQDMMVHIICEYYRRIDYQPELAFHLIKKHMWYKKDYLYYYSVVPLFISRHQIGDAWQCLSKLKEDAAFTQCAYQQFFFYNMKACIQVNTDFRQAKRTLQHCHLLLKRYPTKFTDYHYATYIHNCGLVYLFQQDYGRALQMFQKSVLIQPSLLHGTLPYIYEAVIKGHFDKEIPNRLLRQYPQNSEGMFQYFYQYFVWRDRDQRICLNLLKNKIFPSLVIRGHNAYRSAYLYAFFSWEKNRLQDEIQNKKRKGNRSCSSS